MTPGGGQLVIAHSDTIIDIYEVSAQSVVTQTGHLTAVNTFHTAFLYANGGRILAANENRISMR